mgnify:CR=1 FL=1
MAPEEADQVRPTLLFPAVATRLSVITQEISSCVADRLPRICGSATTRSEVRVAPNTSIRQLPTGEGAG